jgi:pSer/pThr/pTyr-binding forkhead associated (FHA) protein
VLAVTSVFIVLLLITVCMSIAAHVVGRLRDRSTHRSELPPLLLPLADELAREIDPSRAPPALESVATPPQPATAPPPATPSLATESATEDPVTSETVHLARPTEEVVQLLPARLEVVAGMPRRQDIRFVRTPGETPHMILGREPADSPHHVTITSSTVSRQHARVAYTNGQWKVVNLSTTNPVIVNDRALPGPRSERTLSDGDKIELGDVVLRFRAS